MSASIFDRRGRWERRTVAPSITSHPRIDAHALPASIRIRPEAFTVNVQDAGHPAQRITVRNVATHGGGYRLDWRCPVCGRPFRYLYRVNQTYQCRRCAGLAYPSSQAHHELAAQTTVDRALAVIAARLRTTPDARHTPTRPRRMYRRTYANLLIEWFLLRELSEALLMNRLCGGLTAGMYEQMGLERDEARQALAVVYQVKRWRWVQRRLARGKSKAGEFAPTGCEMVQTPL